MFVSLCVDCAISQLETFWKSCLVPSLPSNRKDTKLTTSNDAIFYSIKSFSSSSARRNDAASSLIFMPSVCAGLLQRPGTDPSTHMQILALTCMHTEQYKRWAEAEKLFLLHLHGKCLWKETDFQTNPLIQQTRWQGKCAAHDNTRPWLLHRKINTHEPKLFTRCLQS